MKVVRFDPHIQPGGQGEVVIALETNKLDGKFERYFRVLSNDPDARKFSSMYMASPTPSRFRWPAVFPAALTDQER